MAQVTKMANSHYICCTKWIYITDVLINTKMLHLIRKRRILQIFIFIFSNKNKFDGFSSESISSVNNTKTLCSEAQVSAGQHYAALH